MTRLTICIPTRNRQAYAMDAVRHMLASTRDDFEILLADNSDDAAPLADFHRDMKDSRLRLLPPEKKPLSMKANWERIPQHARGEWLSFIGDDDYLDPDLCEALRVASARVPNVDAFTWGRSYFVWPEARPDDREITKIPTGSHLVHMEKKDLMRKMFFWEGAKDRPACSFGVYHGALKKDLMERIRDAFSNRYFEHPNADYDSICKTVMMADSCIYWERPLSVFGSCSASNSAGLRDDAIGAARLKTFREENDDLEAADFPFPIDLGLTASVAHTIEWFKQRYGIELNGWEESFIKACAGDCESQSDRPRYDAKKAAYAAAIKQWGGATALKQFNPVYRYRADVPKFMGHAEGHLNFDMAIGNARTAAEFYKIINGMLFPVRLLEGRLSEA